MLHLLNARNRAAYNYIKGKFDHAFSREEVDSQMREVEEGFDDKLRRVAGRLASSVIEDLLVAYLAMRDPETPMAAKAALAGALLYFISPFDAVSDILPFGLADDAAVLAAALSYVSKHIKPHHRAEARATADRLFRRGAKETS